MKNLLVSHFRSLSKAIRKNIARVKKRCDKKAVHEFRVLNKRLRAFLMLMRYIEPELHDTGKAYRRLRKLFKRAGEVRDAQVQADVLKEFHFKKEDSGFGLSQKQAISQAKHRFIDKLEGFKEKDALDKIFGKVKKAAAARSHAAILKHIMKFAQQCIAQAVSLSENNDLHKARAKLKTAHYCLDIIHDKPEARSLIATIDPIEQKTGKWRDCVLTSENLKLTQVEQGKRPHLLEVDRNISKEIARLETQLQKDFRRLKRMTGENSRPRQSS